MLFSLSPLKDLFHENKPVFQSKIKEYFLTCTNSFLFLLPQKIKQGDTLKLEIVTKDEKKYIQALKENFVIGFLSSEDTEDILNKVQSEYIYAKVVNLDKQIENNLVKISLF